MSDTQATEQELSGSNREEVLTALFAQLVLQQTNLAMMLLGKTPHPQTGRTVQDIDGARMFIDQLEMLEAKTKGNLSKEEQTLLKQSLMSLHLAFVEAIESPRPSHLGSTPAAPPSPAESTGAASESKPTAEPSVSEPESGKKFSKKY